VQRLPPTSIRRTYTGGCWLASISQALLIGAFLGLGAGPLAAAERGDEDEERKAWQENEVQLPAFPQDEKLIPFEVSATTNNRFLVDGDSLSVGSDGVLRFTLVIVSPSGARNISYEGMRCATGERRVYALGRADRTWSKARSDRWQTISENTLNRHYAALFSDYFCHIDVRLRDADDARRALRHGGQPTALRR